MPYLHGTIDEVYWKLYRKQTNGLVTVVCMQWFDEYDYYESLFIRDSDCNHHKFGTEELAIDWLNEKFPADDIDPEYRRGNNSRNVMD